MNSLSDKNNNTEIIERINHLSFSTQRQWGKMSAAQMLAHCAVGLHGAMSNEKQKRSFMGFFFGKIAKKQVFKDEPFKKELPTDKKFIIHEDKNFDSEKNNLISLIQKFSAIEPGNIGHEPHPFFGKMTADEWGILQWKHLDHHLRQFGV